eukprot:m.51811 g.51811  ORF g.51811 m.51811 type:complete len:574 (+) comp7585_c0_seq1:83-1804(+)
MVMMVVVDVDVRSVVAVAALVGLVCCFGTANGFIDDGTRTVRFWPPLNGGSNFGMVVGYLDPCVFKFIDNTSDPNSAIPTAIEIYKDVIFNGASCNNSDKGKSEKNEVPMNGFISQLLIFAEAPANLPSTYGSDESYALQVPSAGEAFLSANSYTGVLRGLETFSQLVLHSALNPNGNLVWNIPVTPITIKDEPEFEHRGVLIDVARTFLPVPYIKTIIDGLMYSKLNVLHIHITDSQSFPLEVKSHPNISNYGAISASQVYTQKDMADIVSYAGERGVRVLPEVDTPGHTRAFGLAPKYTDIVSCPNEPQWGTFCNEPPCGQLNIANEHTYEVLANVTDEFVALFPEKLYHFGYDEINFNCWKSDPSVQAYLEEHHMTINELLVVFFQRQRQQMGNRKQLVYWEEAVKQTPPLPLTENDTVQIWGDSSSVVNVLNNTNVKLIISPSDQYYLDCGGANLYGDQAWCSPYKTWWHMYTNNFLNGTTPENKNRIIGGESANWGEVSGIGNTMTRIFPRAGAYGARLWNYEMVERREAILAMADYQQRLEDRGIESEGITTRFCRYQPDLCYQEIV